MYQFCMHHITYSSQRQQVCPSSWGAIGGPPSALSPCGDCPGCRMSCLVTVPSQGGLLPVPDWHEVWEAWPSLPNSGQFCRAVPAPEHSAKSTKTPLRWNHISSLCAQSASFPFLTQTWAREPHSPSQTSCTATLISEPTSRGPSHSNDFVTILQMKKLNLRKVTSLRSESHLLAKPRLSLQICGLQLPFPSPYPSKSYRSVKAKAKFSLLPEASLASPFWPWSFNHLLYLAHSHGPIRGFFLTITSQYMAIVLSFSFSLSYLVFSLLSPWGQMSFIVLGIPPVAIPVLSIQCIAMQWKYGKIPSPLAVFQHNIHRRCTALPHQFPLCFFWNSPELCDREHKAMARYSARGQYCLWASVPNCTEPHENVSQIIFDQIQSNNKEETTYQE